MHTRINTYMRMIEVVSEAKVVTVSKPGYFSSTEHKVWINPRPDELMVLLERAPQKQLRFMIDDSMYVWEAYYSTHPDVAELLGIEHSRKRMEAGDLLTGILVKFEDGVLLYHVNQGYTGYNPDPVLQHPLFQRATRGLKVDASRSA